VVEGDCMRSTFGTSLSRQTTDERSVTSAIDDRLWIGRLDRLQRESPRWIVVREPLAEWDPAGMTFLDDGWVALTPIRIGAQDAPLGVFSNDTAISHLPVDDAQQEVLAVFCSLLAHVIEQKRAQAKQRVATAGLQAIVDVADDLLDCPGEDSLYRLAVEFARERLGLERAGLLAVEQGFVRGTFGTDMDRNTTDERALYLPMEEHGWHERLQRLAQEPARWTVVREPRALWSDASMHQLDEGWIALTEVRAGAQEQPLCVFCNDTAISGAPVDEAQQEVLAVFCSFLAHIIEQKAAETSLRMYADTMSAVAFAAEQFMRHGFCADSAGAVLERLGRATGASRAYVAQNHVDASGEPVSSLRYEWALLEAARTPGAARVPTLSISDPGFQWAAELLRDGRTATGLVRDLPPAAREALEPQGIVSVALVPVFADGAWWGTIGLDECVREREWTELELAPLTVAAGLLGASIQRYLAEERTQESRETAWALLNSHHQMAMLVNADWTVAGVNEAFAQQLGRSIAELTGTDAISHLPADAAERLRALGEEAARTGLPARFEDERDGRAFANAIHPIADVDGRVAKLAVFSQDVTDRKHAEETGRLAAVGQLAAGIAHEFNNLLGAMMLSAEIASYRGGEDDYKGLADMVLRATARGAEICRNLTTFARPREPERQPVFIEQAIEAALSVAAQQITNAQVAVSFSYHTDKRHVFGDPGQLEQVFLDLFINACHAMPNGGTLTIVTRHAPGEAGPGEIVATVADTGTGIEPGHLSRIFEPFFTTKGRLGESDTPGTGLGLSVSHGIVKAHGGTITVRSEVEVGTSFEIRFPVHETAAAARLECQPDTETFGGPGVGAAPRVLVADDEKDIRFVVGEALAAMGCEVLGVGTTQEAVEALQRDRFDVVITDLLMPGGGGREVLAFAGRLEDPPAVVIMTGRDAAGCSEELLAAGARHCLAKPFRAAELVAVVRALMA
jgi:PAS domain S-box-containing protein